VAWEPPECVRCEVERLSHQVLGDCYQCGKCSGNCPVAPEMDFLPHQVLRLILTGNGVEAVTSRAIWQCDACLTCSTRCPRGIDVASVMDALRALAPRDEDTAAIFAEAFLDGVRRMGRANELPLGLVYNMRRRKLFENSDVGWQLFRHGKLPLWPKHAPGVAPIMRRVAEIEARELSEHESEGDA
jgi:heterodisulfide reductase subunit C2